MSSFHVDGRISIKLEYDFAMKIAEFILSSGTDDKKLLALAHKLSKVDEEEPPTYKKDWQSWEGYHKNDSKEYRTLEGHSNEGMYSKEETVDNWEGNRKPPIRIRRTHKV
jgi:hypothetical protein